jgi:cyanophycinase-like exopeptidase
VLPPALEVLTAWSIAETEADPSVFRQAMDRTIGEAVSAQDPLRRLAEMMFGLSALSGILLDELAQATGRSCGEVLQAVHLRYLDPSYRDPGPGAARPPHVN